MCGSVFFLQQCNSLLMPPVHQPCKWNIDLTKYFQLPEKEVAKQLGVCLTSLKKMCRQSGINRWPYRKVHRPESNSLLIFVLISHDTLSSLQIKSLDRKMQELQGAALAAQFCKSEKSGMNQEISIHQTQSVAKSVLSSEKIPSDSKEHSSKNKQHLLNKLNTRPNSDSSSSKLFPSPQSLQHHSLERDSPVSNSDEADDDGSLDLTFDIPDGDGFWNHVREIPSTPSATDSEALPPATPLAADVEYVDGNDSAFDNEDRIGIVGPNEDPEVGSLLPIPTNTNKAAGNSDPLLPAADEDIPKAGACSPPPHCRHHWSEWPAPAADATDAVGASSQPAASDAELIALLASCAGTPSAAGPASLDPPGRADAADADWDFIFGL